MVEFCAGIIFINEEHKSFFTKNLPNAETSMYTIWH